MKNILWIAQTKINPNFINIFTSENIKLDVLCSNIDAMKKCLSSLYVKNEIINLVNMHGVVFLPLRVLFYLLFHKYESYDVIMTESPVFGGLGGVIAKKMLKKPLIIKIGILFEDYFLKSSKRKFMLPIYKLIIKYVYKNTDLIIADNEIIEADIRRYSPNANIEICIPYGIDTSIFKPPKNIEEKLVLRKKYSLPKDKILGIFVGRFTQEKGGAEYLIRAMKNVNEKINNFHLLLIGKGDLEPKYKNLIKDFKLKNVELRDQVPHNQVAELMRASDIYIQPSLSEGHGIAPLEAMASGLLVVATAVGGLKLTVKEGITGFVVSDPYKPIFYERALLRAVKTIKNKDFSIVKNARKFVQQNFEADLVKKKLLELVKSVVNN